MKKTMFCSHSNAPRCEPPIPEELQPRAQPALLLPSDHLLPLQLLPLPHLLLGLWLLPPPTPSWLSPYPPVQSQLPLLRSHTRIPYHSVEPAHWQQLWQPEPVQPDRSQRTATPQLSQIGHAVTSCDPCTLEQNASQGPVHA